MMAVQPAFTSVSVRPSLADRSAAQAPSAAASFPQGVTNYVQRAFFEFNRLKDSPTFAGITDHDIRNKLSEVVTQAKSSGEIESRNWLLQPLPHEYILEERKQAAFYQTQGLYGGPALPAITTPNRTSFSTSQNTPVNHKRKSPDTETTDAESHAVTPPWKKPATTSSLIDRITVKSKKEEKKRKAADKLRGNVFDSSHDALEKRRQRFGDLSIDSTSRTSSRDDSPLMDARAGPIVGTCLTLEKNYFRLTAPPNPDTVRPLAVLERALQHVCQQWEQRHDYNYVCDQLKSIRQDLTVQRIKTPFTIQVYEVHARIALSRKDLGEYNQCQTQLRALYSLRLGEGGSSGGNDDEFLAYRILYFIYTNNRADMNDMLASLTSTDKRRPCAMFALQVRAALASGNYHKLFKLYRQSPKFGLTKDLMDMFIERERLAAMSAICRVYKPDVSLSFLADELAFSVDEADPASWAKQSCNEFICKHRGQSLLQAKSDGEVRVLVGKAGALFEDAKRTSFGKVDIKGQI